MSMVNDVGKAGANDVGDGDAGVDDGCGCDDRSMLASLWLHPGPSGHARQRQNAILKFSLVYMVSEET